MARPTSRFRVDGPAITPPPFGLFSAVQLIPHDDAELRPEWRGGIEWDAVNAGYGSVAGTVDACTLPGNDPGDPAPAGAAKTETAPFAVQYGDAVTLYAVTDCSTVGRTSDDERARAGRILTNGEQQALESIIESGSLTLPATTVVQDASFRADATFMGPYVGIPVDPWGALAQAEAFGGHFYGSVGWIIHMSTAAASVLGDRLVRNGARLETIIGTPVVVGTGYDGNPPAAAGADAESLEGYGWLYVTGPMVVHRGPIVLNPTPSTIDRDVNRSVVIAERDYAYGWDGEPYAVPFPKASLWEPYVPDEG